MKYSLTRIRITSYNVCYTKLLRWLYRDKLSTRCVACHRKDDQKKGHRRKFGDKCETCHTEKNWKDSKFDHDRDTKYRITSYNVCYTKLLRFCS